MPIRRRRSPFTWDVRASRFRRGATGQFLSKRTVIRAFELAIAKNARELREISLQLRAGEISLRAWQLETALRLKDAHLWGAAIARGGRLSQADYGRLGQLLKSRYSYLSRFAADIQSGKQPLDGRFLSRASAYLLHARQARHDAERHEMFEVQGFRFEENRLSTAENCAGCLEATALGPVPIGTLPEIGTRDCLYNCKCEVVYS